MAMAFVDATKLDSDLTSIASAIRTKGGTTASLAFPSGFVSAINDIQTGGGGDALRSMIERTASVIADPSVSAIASYAFFNYSGLENVSFAACKIVRSSAFNSCYRLSAVTFPICTSIEQSAFLNCSALSEVNFPAVERLANSVFANCSSLKELFFPELSSIGTAAFANCTALEKVSLPACKAIGNSAFTSCGSLSLMYLLGSAVATLGANALRSTYLSRTGGSIFVRASLLSEWMAASSWSAVASLFVGLTDDEIAALEG